MAKMICRTCLKVCARGCNLYDMVGNYRPDGDTTKFSDLLKYIAPEMYLGASKKPDICFRCVDALMSAYNFRKTCLRTEQMINKYLQQARCTAESIDLLDVLALNGSSVSKKEPANYKVKLKKYAGTPQKRIEVKILPKVNPEVQAEPQQKNDEPKAEKLFHIDSVYSVIEKTYEKPAPTTMPVQIKQEKLSPVPEKQIPSLFVETPKLAPLVPQETPPKKRNALKIESTPLNEEITIKEEVLDPETDPLAEPFDSNNLQGIIDSIDRSCDNEEYDIPEFIQINKIELEQIQPTENYQSKIVPLKIATSIAGTMQNSSLSLTGQNQMPRNILLQSFGNGLPPLVPLAATNLQNENGFYLAANIPPETATPITTAQAMPSPVLLPKSTNLSPVPKTTQSVQTVEKRKRGRVKIVPVAEVAATKIAEPDTVCPPYSTYSPDGSYINDHDYLITPYKKKGSQQDKQLECFICGNKHAESRHASHMKKHSSTCDVCKEDLGTPFMLNLHYKTHSKPCKLCTETVPYRDIKKHEQEHLEEDRKFEESDVEKTQFGCHRGKKRQKDDEKPVYFPVKLTDCDPAIGFKLGSHEDNGLIIKRRGRKKLNKLNEETSALPVRKSPRISKSVKHEELSDAAQSDDGTNS